MRYSEYHWKIGVASLCRSLSVRGLTLVFLAWVCVFAIILSSCAVSAVAAPPETPETLDAEPVTATAATLHGILDPKNTGEVGTYQFLYRPSATECTGGKTAPEEPASAMGQKEEAVSTEVTGLLPATTYTFCLLNRNGGFEEAVGSPVTFTTLAAAPTIAEETLSDVGSASATVSAQVNPAGLPTAYRVEYGTTIGYGLSTPETSAGAGGGAPVSAQVHLSGLRSGTVYHARMVAVNELGAATPGADLTFTTSASVSASASTLPDSRAYEMVSPVTRGDGNVYIPPEPSLEERHDLQSEEPYRSSTDGEAVAYIAEPLPSGGNGSTGEGFGNEFLATRGPTGWNALDIMPPRRANEAYSGFSSDLAVGVLTLEVQPPLTPDAPANCKDVYLRTASDNSFHAAFTMTQTPGECGVPLYAGTSADDSHVIIESEAALTPEAVAHSEGEYNLYESVAGKLYLVSVLPDGAPAVKATFGVSSGFPEGQSLETEGSDFDRVVSSDGSRIVWTDLDTEKEPHNPTGATRLFVRVNADSPTASTIQVDSTVGGGGQYWGSSEDDSRIFFTKAGHLYEYDLDTANTTDLTSGGGVVGVTGVSEHGGYLYFVATTVLASNENSEGEKASPGSCEEANKGNIGKGNEEKEEEQRGILPPGRGCNLYALHVGEPARFVATLMPHDDSRHGPNGTGFFEEYGDWRASLTLRTAEVTPDGRSVVFATTRSLTGYENNSVRELFVYDDESRRLSCASCNPTGEPAKGEGFAQGETYPPVPGGSHVGTYQYRWISADGSRVFFDSSEALVPQDSNGVEDVYEWERDGAGSCRQSAGCVYLLSGDFSAGEALFVDASENGNDVFFTSRADLVPQDRGETVVLYDARVNGGFPRSSAACTGTGCQGAPPASPSFATPPSATFNGIGNYPPAPSRSSKSRTAAQTRVEHLTRALTACRAKRNRHRRAVCEAQARRRYGPPKVRKTSAGANGAGDKRRAKR